MNSSVSDHSQHVSQPTATELLDAKRKQLLAVLSSYGRCLVAFSGGVDSAVVAKAAKLSLGENALAVTGESSSLASGELENASEVARRIGIRHEIISTGEFSRPAYVQNRPDRCYHCKTELYSQLASVSKRFGDAVIVNGANVDDLEDYRPGMAAAGEHQIKSPLADCGINKAEVRLLALAWDLPVWDKPATPCLSSRVAYGEEVTPERLHMIDQAELHLRQLGLGLLRVRFHRGDLARLEVPVSELSRLCDPQVRLELITKLRLLGFKYITLDLEGFRSGSQNQVLPVEMLQTYRP